MSGWPLRGAALTASLAAHGWLLVANGQGHATPRPPRPPAFVQLIVAAPEPALAPEPAPPPEPPAAKAAPQPAIPKATPVTATPEPPPETPPETAAAPPPELTGTTLVADAEQGAGWSAPRGSGSARDGLVRSGAVGSIAPQSTAEPTRATQTIRPPQPPQLPEALPLSQLSRKPSPPPLTAALERNYPATARSIGQSGDASVRARIEANGELRLANIVVETAAGFGDACRRTLLASKWSAPLDRAGKPVATWITYRCRFRIGD